MTLGATILTLRKARGLSLTDVEGMTGINKGALSKFERGLEGLGPQNFDKLCTLFGTTPSVIYAIAHNASNQPDLINDSQKLQVVVRNLTRLIDKYLQAPEEIRAQVDSLLD
ncbi:helix-turn-helix domain-containing protein [Kaarinaea lacus]